MQERYTTEEIEAAKEARRQENNGILRPQYIDIRPNLDTGESVMYAELRNCMQLTLDDIRVPGTECAIYAQHENAMYLLGLDGLPDLKTQYSLDGAQRRIKKHYVISDTPGLIDSYWGEWEPVDYV